MKIHEYQARSLLADAGIPVPSGRMIESIEDAVNEALDELALAALAIRVQLGLASAAVQRQQLAKHLN